MPVLHLTDVPGDVFERLRQRATLHQRTAEAEAVDLLRQSLTAVSTNLSQAELLAEMRRRSFTPPASMPDNTTLIREDRER